MVISIGSQIGPFEVVSLLGTGGMGHVYRARDNRLGRDVALKVLPPSVFDQEEWLARFQREAKIISNLNHPNILTIHEIGEAQLPGVIGLTHYIVTEYIDGVTMREAMATERDPNALLGRMAQVADALAKAHAAGIVHRDLKPDNIMFSRDGFAKVLDFGLAKAFNAPTDAEGRRTFQTQQGITVGTIGYMSPEQIEGRGVDHRADIFSFGCILYEMVTGKLPFEGETLIETLHAIVRSKPSAVPVTVDYQLRQIVKRCLEKDVNARFQSMQEIATLLREAAGPAGAPKRASRATSSSKNAAASSTRLRTLAIMPFANVNDDPEMEYLSDGITETIIYTLSQVRKRLRVLARSTVFAYKGKSFTPQQLAAEVGATSVVMGRVQRMGPSIVVTADLVNANDGTQVWGERFHRPLHDIFELQDELATSISDQLRLKLTAGDRQRLVHRPTKRSEAYELFLKGRFYLNQRTPDSLQRALRSFEEAVAIDRKYAQAWAGLAEVHTVLRSRAITRADDSCQRAEEAAEKAIELDPSLAEPRATLGSLAWMHRWKWNEADRLFRIAIRLDPHCVTARQWHSGLYVWLGMFDEARQEAKLAVDYEPLSLVLNLNYSGMLYVSGRLEEAMSVCRKVLELEPRFFFAHWMHGRILLARGLPSDAVDVLRAAVDDCGRHPELLGTLGYAYARSGRDDEARTLLRELESTGTEARNAMHLGEVWLGLNNLERAMHYIEQLFVRRGDLGVVLSSPEFQPLREHPAFAAMLERVGFPARELHTSMPRTMMQSMT